MAQQYLSPHVQHLNWLGSGKLLLAFVSTVELASKTGGNHYFILVFTTVDVVNPPLQAVFMSNSHRVAPKYHQIWNSFFIAFYDTQREVLEPVSEGGSSTTCQS
jgi:hypothetical protein